MIFDNISKAYIFGAHTRAGNLKAYLERLYPHVTIEGFIVTDRRGNPMELEGCQVLELSQLPADINVDCIFVATKSAEHDKIIAVLSEKVLCNIVPITVELDNFLRNAYFKQYFQKGGMSGQKLEELCEEKTANASRVNDSDFGIYMAESIYDKGRKHIHLPWFVQSIQAGAALTDIRLAEVTDAEGDNISCKNRQYSELTVLYWMWKNAKEDYQGLCHYRRHFVLREEWLEVIEEEGIEVILPVPSICVPSVSENYCSRHSKEDWEYLMLFLKERLPQYYECAKEIFDGRLYFTCNMFIMKKNILDGYCSWLFPILEAMEKHIGIKDDVYQNRYIGFMAERLLTLYFLFHAKEYRIVYLDKNFVS